jgi:hypothetical protein
MSVMPEQGTPQQQQSFEQALSQLMVLLSAITSAQVVHLSRERSVNLRHVARYEAVEVFERFYLNDKGKAVILQDGEQPPDGKKEDFRPYEPKQFAPAIFFGGSDDPNLLTDQENEVFRRMWQRHAHLTGSAYAILDGIFPQVEVPIDANGSEPS